MKTVGGMLCDGSTTIDAPGGTMALTSVDAWSLMSGRA